MSLAFVIAVFGIVLIAAILFARPLYKITFPKMNASLYWLGDHDDDLLRDIHNGAKINLPNSYGTTPLHFAILWSSAENVKILIRNGADIHAQDSHGASTLLRAAEGAPLENFQLLIEAGANVNGPDAQGVSPLHRSVSLGNSQDTQGGNFAALLRAGADVFATTNTGDTPLHWSAASYTPQLTLRQLIEAGAKLNTVNQRGKTPLHSAAEFGEVLAVEILLNAAVDISITDDQGKLAYDYAVKNPQLNQTPLLQRLKFSHD